MDEFGAVAEPEIQEVEQVEQETPETPEQPEQQAGESDNKFSKRFTAWLKGKNESLDPEDKYNARFAKDLYGRDLALRQIYPNGVNDVREVKAALDGIQHGELRGVEALGAIQDQVRDYEQSDELLAAGDPKVLDLFGDDFNEGLGKLTPAILDRIQQSNPEAYSAAILPHLVSALASSPLVAAQNAMADILSEPPPAWMTPNQKSDWIQDKFARIIKQNDLMANWLNAQAEATKGRQVPAANGRVPASNQLSQEREALDNEKRQMYWDKNIHPETKSFGDNRFQELMKPYAGRLKLDAPAMDGLKKAFLTGVVQKLGADRAYTSQLSRYQRQMNPDAKTVVNLANVNFDKHAKSVLEGLIDERGYRKFMGQRPMNTPNGNGAKPAPAASGVTIVSVKPAFSDIDHKNTPIEWLRMHKYRMTNGRVVQVKN